MPTFANPLGLLALLGIPAVLAIHFLQRKARELPVSTLFLLDHTRREAAGGRRFERLIPSIPLWMQLLAVLLLILPVTQAAVDFMNNLTSYLLPPRVLDAEAHGMADGHDIAGTLLVSSATFSEAPLALPLMRECSVSAPPACRTRKRLHPDRRPGTVCAAVRPGDWSDR